MAQKKNTDDRDVIAQLADIGEDTLRRLVERPRRMVHGIEQRVRDVASRLRAIDPLDSRVAALEKRLESLEETEKATARRASAPAKASTTRTARKAVATKPGPAEHVSPRSDEVTNGALEGDEAQATNERGPVE